MTARKVGSNSVSQRGFNRGAPDASLSIREDEIRRSSAQYPRHWSIAEASWSRPARHIRTPPRIAAGSLFRSCSKATSHRISHRQEFRLLRAGNNARIHFKHQSQNIFDWLTGTMDKGSISAGVSRSPPRAGTSRTLPREFNRGIRMASCLPTSSPSSPA